MFAYIPFFTLCTCLINVLALDAVSVPKPCPAAPPCDCDWTSINCDSRNLSEVPRFNLSEEWRWQLDLSSNNIKYIPSKAFINITGLEFLKIANNNIVEMADDALFGAENTLEFLFMRDNKMAEVPTALGKMRKVSSLSIDGNPVQDFQAQVFQNVSSTLQYLEFGYPGMSFWPDSIRYLTNLTSLTVTNLNMDYLPLSSFLGLENSLGLLGFEKCTIRSLPLSLSTLNALEVLSLDSNPYLTLSGIPKEAFSGMPSLDEISIRNQSFDTIPDIFHDALRIRDIETSGTPITHFDASMIPDENNLQTVRLSDTLLREFPSAITKMKEMQSLIIRNSSITSVPASAFEGLTKVTYIGITDAPLTSFSDDALRDARNLQWLFLSNTNLTTIPRAITGLQNIRNVDLEGNKVICTCASLGWLKHWDGNDFFFPVGDCSNLKNVSLSDYYREQVPKCPEEIIIL
ncbi:leucine-rich repeat-containing G-protein coupled receptor 4-like [Argopecten irradians]|uniref:leucine-rich repeat-containing G-protein coupled receptor 4-like n=1 Tax=Argopecten irradians TaxID=31199 RepID=UPI003720E74C